MEDSATESATLPKKEQQNNNKPTNNRQTKTDQDKHFSKTSESNYTDPLLLIFFSRTPPPPYTLSTTLYVYAFIYKCVYCYIYTNTVLSLQKILQLHPTSIVHLHLNNTYVLNMIHI